MLNATSFVLLLELLDEAEFGEVAAKSEHDEDTINPASDLGLMVCARIE